MKKLDLKQMSKVNGGGRRFTDRRCARLTRRAERLHDSGRYWRSGHIYGIISEHC